MIKLIEYNYCLGGEAGHPGAAVFLVGPYLGN